jgi:hypothetical protein
VTETSTRLPADAPLVASAESPVLLLVYGLLFLCFLLGIRHQLRQRGRRMAHRGLAHGVNP